MIHGDRFWERNPGSASAKGILPPSGVSAKSGCQTPKYHPPRACARDFLRTISSLNPTASRRVSPVSLSPASAIIEAAASRDAIMLYCGEVEVCMA